jgi:hypothetical protein
VLQSKTQLGPIGDMHVLVVNSFHREGTRVTLYRVPSPEDFESTKIQLRKTISDKPYRDNDWIVYPGNHTQAFLDALNLNSLPEIYDQSIRFARIILPG